VAVRMWIDQLVAQGFVRRSGEYQTLSLTDAGRRLLKRDGTPKLSIANTPKKKRESSQSNASWDGVDRKLFEKLRALRSQLASERNVPAYIIFGDATLRDLARYRPSNLNDFGRIKGIGTKKQEDFGAAFIALIAAYGADRRE
jgi:ATP-dependent DNA helicase RecQ